LGFGFEPQKQEKKDKYLPWSLGVILSVIRYPAWTSDF
jgi:hypothetical protein